ncbi:MAG: hypothetical protein WAN35_14185 [Terracidiphilus sp.]
MKRISFLVAALLVFTIAFDGCKKQEQCASGDSPELCKAVQGCFASGTSTVACREAEKDANKQRTDYPAANSGGADTLNYDSSKAAQKPAPKQPPKQ